MKLENLVSLLGQNSSEHSTELRRGSQLEGRPSREVSTRRMVLQSSVATYVPVNGIWEQLEHDVVALNHVRLAVFGASR